MHAVLYAQLRRQGAKLRLQGTVAHQKQLRRRRFCQARGKRPEQEAVVFHLHHASHMADDRRVRRNAQLPTAGRALRRAKEKFFGVDGVGQNMHRGRNAHQRGLRRMGAGQADIGASGGQPQKHPVAQDAGGGFAGLFAVTVQHNGPDAIPLGHRPQYGRGPDGVAVQNPEFSPVLPEKVVDGPHGKGRGPGDAEHPAPQ